MSTQYDLHSHSTASDGTLSPQDLVRRAHAAGVGCLALTDHDTTAGIAEARAVAKGLGLSLVAGVEVSVTWGGQAVHIVGLGVDPADKPLQDGLSKLREYRSWRAEEIGRRLEKHGIEGAYQGACEFALGELVGRTHFARFLVARGHAPDERRVFKRFLTRGKPGHVPGQWAELEQAVGWIRLSGGQAVIAHPARYDMSRRKLRQLIGEFAELGGEALEVVSGSHNRDDYINMARHADDFGLMASAGSDYHGPEGPWIELGRLPALPEGCVPIWSGWSEAGRPQALAR